MRDLDVRDLVSDTGSMSVSVTEFRGGVDVESKRMLEPLEEDDLGENLVRFESCGLSRWHCRQEGVFERSICVLGDNSQSAVIILMIDSMTLRCHAVAGRV